MTETQVIEALRERLAIPVGRHLYAVLGTYATLDAFTTTLRLATMPDGQPFPEPRSLTRGILETIPEAEFQAVAADEARHPIPTVSRIKKAFDDFLRQQLSGGGLLVLSHPELLFAYKVDLGPLRNRAADADRILLLLPGTRENGRIVLFHQSEETRTFLPTNLFADNHVWEVSH